MIDHELTDPAGGALTITHDHQGVWVTATEDRDEVTVGPFLVTSLTEAVTVESDAEVSGDLMDGGVTSAAIEAEVVSPERARSLVQERDDLRESYTLALKYLDEAQATIASLRAENPRPLTAADISGEMVKRAKAAIEVLAPSEQWPGSAARWVLEAALTPPPSRCPEAVALSSELEAVLAHLGIGDVHVSQEERDEAADLLAERGVRVTGAES